MGSRGGSHEIHAFRPADRPGTLEDRQRLRPIGRNTERYQQMLDELRKLACSPTTPAST